MNAILESRQILRPVSGAERIRVRATDGVDPSILNEGLSFRWSEPNSSPTLMSVVGSPTRTTYAQIFRIVETATFIEIFESFSRDLDSLSFTRGQLVCLVNDCHQYYMVANGLRSLFLLQERGSLCVAMVVVHNHKVVEVCKRFLMDPVHLNPEVASQVVVPI
jgi:hypothetical protein